MWTTPPETPTQASQGQPYAVPPSTSSYPAKRSSSMLDGEGDAYGMNGSQKRFKSNGNAGPGYNNDYRQSPSQAPGSSQTTVTANGGWIRTASSQSTGGYGTQDSLDEDEWDFVAPPPPTHQTLAPSPFPLTPPPNAGPSRSTNSRYLPSSTTSPAFPPLSQIGIGVDSGFPPSTQSAEFTLSEIDDMIKSTLEHADDLEEQANQMRLHAKQLEGLKAYLEKVERKRKASEKSVEFKVGYIARLKEEIESLKKNQR